MLDQELGEAQQQSLRDEEIQEMLLLATRVKEAHGGELDDAAIQAVCEATGAPLEYVRLALRSVDNRKRPGLIQRTRNLFLSLDPDVRRYVASGYLACTFGLFHTIARTFGDRSSLLGILMIILAVVGVYNVSLSKDTRVAAISGALFGALQFISAASFTAIFGLFGRVPPFIESSWLLLFTLIGSVLGVASHKLVNRNRTKLGLQDPAGERQELLKQLVDLQDKLRSGEKSLTFLSVDIVGSTKMKELADPLAVEFTFNEYHKYVETLVKRHGGRIHSTAGDGMTCAFDHPQQAFSAGRNIQAGLIELNTHRNKIGFPIQLRAAIHCGTVMAPGQDVQSLNFAHVIDIAAHLQKACPPGCIAVSDAAADSLPGGRAAIGSEQVAAQNINAIVWRPKSRIEAMPALPNT